MPHKRSTAEPRLSTAGLQAQLHALREEIGEKDAATFALKQDLKLYKMQTGKEYAKLKK